MKKKFFIFLLLICSIIISKAQYISSVLEYTPAPGQWINSAPWGMPTSGQSIIGKINGTLNLGAFGGYVVFRFAEPVENHPDNPFGVDFTVFGNPLPTWSEPAVVYVMKDENDNEQPDDTWYELAGSDYFFSTSKHNYQVTYTNPGGETAQNVPWADNLGETGVIKINDAHSQPYYPIVAGFEHINTNSYMLTGSYIRGVVDTTEASFVKSIKRCFGYADNQIRGNAPYTLPDNPYTKQKENSGGDAFDIAWAVDNFGNYVDLDKIHFVKIQSAMLANAGWLGEVSTEITGAVDVAPNSSVSGINSVIVIKELPKIISDTEFQIEAFVFYNGRLDTSKKIIWQTDNPYNYIDQNNILHLRNSGDMTITATLEEDSEIIQTVKTKIELTQNIYQSKKSEIVIFPNPATDYFSIEGNNISEVKIFDLTGKLIYTNNNYQKNQHINIIGLNSGIYFVKICKNNDVLFEKLIIK